VAESRAGSSRGETKKWSGGRHSGGAAGARVPAQSRRVSRPPGCSRAGGALAMSLQATNSCCGKIRNTTNVLRGG